MSVMSWIVLAALATALYVWYATIVTRRNRVLEALAGVDVQLQKRHDLIPNVLTLARRYMEHERGLLEEITSLRARARDQAGERDFERVAERFDTETVLGQRLGSLFALAENYPQLRADGPMIEAQRTYTEVETNIAAARRFYNSAAAELRNSVQIFPGNLLRALAGVHALPPQFAAVEEARTPVEAGRYL